MKKTIFLSGFTFQVLFASAQIKVYSTKNVAIGGLGFTPNSTLTVGSGTSALGNSLYKMYVYSNGTSSNSIAIYGDKTAVSSGNGYGIYGNITNGSSVFNYGTSGLAYNASITTGRSYGLIGQSGNATDGYNYGTYGRLIGSKKGAGIYGTEVGDFDVSSVSNGTFAGFFYGDLLTTDDAPEKPNAGSWSGYSDKRLKKDILPFNDGLAIIRQIKPVTYKFNNVVPAFSNGKTYVGVLAQEIQQAAPFCVETGQLKIKQSDSQEFNVVQTFPADTSGEANVMVDALTFNYDGLIYVLINSVKELDAKVTHLENLLKLTNSAIPTNNQASKVDPAILKIANENGSLRNENSAMKSQLEAMQKLLEELNKKVNALSQTK